MRINFGQVYVEAGATLPFSCQFQQKLSDSVSALIAASEGFRSRHRDWHALTFNISARHSIQSTQVRGPTTFKRSHVVEYTIFLPFDDLSQRPDAPRVSLEYILNAVTDVLDGLGLDISRLKNARKMIVDSICSDRDMVEPPSWDPLQNAMPIRKVFNNFFGV